MDIDWNTISNYLSQFLSGTGGVSDSNGQQQSSQQLQQQPSQQLQPQPDNQSSLGDYLAQFASGIGRVAEGVGTLGVSELKRQDKQTYLKQAGDIIRASPVPAFLYNDPATTPEEIQRANQQGLLQKAAALYQLPIESAQKEGIDLFNSLTDTPDRQLKRQQEKRLSNPTYTLSPGQTRYDASNKPIVSMPARDTAKDQQIQRIMDATGTDYGTAVGITDGVMKVVTDPMSGQPFVVDMVKGTTRKLIGPTASPAGNSAAPPTTVSAANPTAQLAQEAGLTPAQQQQAVNITQPTVPPVSASTSTPNATPVAPVTTPMTNNKTLYQQTELGTGPISAAGDLYSSTLGALGAPLPAETLKARTALQLGSQQLIESLKRSGRLLSQERSDIKEATGIEPRLLQSPAALQLKMQSIDGFLRDKLNDAVTDAGNDELPIKTRQAARVDAVSINNFLTKLGVPQGNAVASPAPRGINPAEWNALTPQERQLWK